MEKSWDTGDAQETALFMHRSDFDRVNYSRDVDKKELGNALQKFVGEFMGGPGTDDADDIPDFDFASNEQLPTPIDTVVCSKYKTQR
jgi:hypothetical protein